MSRPELDPEKSPEQKKAPERDTTDESLRVERRKTDTELAASQGAIKDNADDAVAEARHQADSVLSDARGVEDLELAAAGASQAQARGVDDERARQDAALTAERGGVDAAARDERAQRQLALASLLAFERHDTDLRLEIERARADEVLTSREDFLAMVSHDLRSLLGGIALRAGMLAKLARSEGPESKVGVHAENIQRFSARMNRLIGDLMDVASIETGKLAVVAERLDAARLCRDSVEAFAPAASAHGLEFVCAPGSDAILAEFDHERVLQVLTNLVGNAIKFTAKGGRISLRVESRADEVCFAVEDTGCGIPADRLDKIFERLFQTQGNDRRGLGLGLYISKSIVESHGGKIWAESAVGRGSTFFFTLPRRAAAGDVPPRSV